ncbi:Glucanosyltransferase-domain-containing protein, partial [Zopfochytrium polystomum]
FVVKGISYQPRDGERIIDPITNGRKVQWKRDLAVMAELGVNVLRVYEVDPEAPHNEFMDALKQRNMFLLLDLGGKHSLNRVSPQYDLALYNWLTKTIDAFADFETIMGFIAGNEVVNSVATVPAAPFVKAIIRDLKAYMKTKARQIPIGYASSDDEHIRSNLFRFLSCGQEEERPDFLGLNLYSWCGASDYVTSKYSARTTEMKALGLPALITEYGCNTVPPRRFSEVQAIYGKEMSKVWSGAVVYEYSEEANGYGLVKITGSGGIQMLPDFTQFHSQMRLVHNRTAAALRTPPPPPPPPPTCPDRSAAWPAATALPGTPSACECQRMVWGLSCVASPDNTTTTTGTSSAGELLGVICGMLRNASACRDVDAGAADDAGTWGRYAYCGVREKLSYVMNAYYLETNRSSNGCYFDGNGKLNIPLGRARVEACSR